MMDKSITFYNNIEDMNDADVRIILDKNEPERIEYFSRLNELWGKGSGYPAAFREYHRWLSLLDDKYIYR